MSIDRVLPFAGVLWFGTMTGFFWSFSAVVMPGLELADPTTALVAMQDINRAVRNPLFGIGFFGAALIALVLAARSLLAGPPRVVPLGAALLYLVGALGVTAIGNVPLNESLALVDRASAGAASAMTAYVREWTLFNHVRTVSALAAMALLAWSLGRTGPARG